jgi:hypothetical protein
MRPRLTTNLIMLGVIIGLIMITLVELKPEKRPPTPISPLELETVTTLKLARGDKPLLQFEKQKAGWVMLSPKKGKADSEKIKALLAIATLWSSSRFPLNLEKTARFGLNPPAITLQLDKLLIKVGDIAPISQQRYLQIDETLYLVSDNFYHHLIAQPDQYLLQTEITP